MNPEQTPRTKEELFSEQERIIEALRFKSEQTAANIAAGVVGEGDLDEDKDALEAELSEINAEIATLAGGSDDQSRLEGV